VVAVAPTQDLPTSAQASDTPTDSPSPEASKAPAPRLTVTNSPATATPGSVVPLRSPTPSPSLTPAPSPSLTLAPSPSLTLAPSAAATAASESGTLIGRSVEGRPISAYRIGHGPIKVVLVGNVHGGLEGNTYSLAEQLLAHFQSLPAEVPDRVSLWIIPTLNPDGLASGGRWNAHDVDLNRNADTTSDGCAGNDWSPDTRGLEGAHPGAGGDYPFSEPETVALRDFMSDAWVAIFYHSMAGAIYADSCQRHLPSARLAAALSAGSGYPVPPEGWAGYRITGDLADYLAGEGVAAVTVELESRDDPEFERNLSGVHSLLAAVDEIVGAEAKKAGATTAWLDQSNTGVWRYPQGSFTHPLALEVIADTAYLVDGGRVLALDLTQPAPARALLAPGDSVEGVRVLEPLDLAAGPTSLLALDRAGDLYRYDLAKAEWALERYGRPSGETSDHYYVALATKVAPARSESYLLEATHEQVWTFTPGQKGSAWAKVAQGRDVDLSVAEGGVYVLTRALNGPKGSLARFQGAKALPAFRPGIDLMRPRQVVAAAGAVYVLDRAGSRLLSLHPASGRLQALFQFPDRRPMGAVAAWPGAGDQGRTPALILAGPDTLYFYRQPERQAVVPGESAANGSPAFDPQLLDGLRGLQMPIEGATVTRRDFQMPGAPRHYRLGVHEGSDFYSGTTGTTIDRRTPVRAVAGGVVVRAMLDYQPLTAAQAAELAARCRALGYTPPEVLDAYRGRQVWIEHSGGLVSRYAHLSSISPGISEGAQVDRGQVIAMVGNSGTPDSIRSATSDVHLHLELWLGDRYIGQFLRPVETREWLERILR
jgi:murein DD-endopeptidase MepM/ murein hydrolase activator NlpD